MKVIFLLISFLSIILFPQDNLKYYAINAFKDSYLVSFDLEEIDYLLFKENYINVLNYNLKNINYIDNITIKGRVSEDIKNKLNELVLKLK